MLLANSTLFLLSCLVLVISGSFLVKTLSKIASFLKISEFLVGFVIMAFSTSIPELFVGISSALAKNPALALGTVIGSNIADLTIIIGIAIVLAKGIDIKSKFMKRDSLYMVFIAALPIVLMLIGGKLSRIDGIILIAVFIGYTTFLIKERTRFRKEVENDIKRKDIVLAVFLFCISLVALFLSAEFVVKYATLLAIDLLLPSIVIGLFFIAIGTSLPELVFGTKSVLTKHPEMALGDIIGAVVINSTLVLGITAIIYPITANFLLFFSSAIFMIIIAFLFATFVESGKKLYWKEGVSLIMLYAFFIMIEFYISTLNG